jgi:hypothetical protein
MNEGTKTGLFWVVAAVLVAIATLVAWPRGGEQTQIASMVGRELFEDFDDPLAAASMKIVTFDAGLGELRAFEVAKDRDTGVWSIPSRQGYPADGSEQMRQAATALLGLKILDVKSELPEDHEDFGVVEPDVEKLEVGDDGVGRLVTIRDEERETLVSLVIGDEVKDNPEHHYVRVPSQDLVYEVELDDSPLTTSFNAWIEDDLLQLSSLDIAGTEIRKYSVAAQLTLDGRIGVDQQRAYDADLSIDDTNQWSLERLIVYDETNTGSTRSLGDEETLNTTTLNQLKNALDDLKIVDVKRKPEGMSADLKADKSLMDNEQSLRSLVTQGFYPTSGRDNELEILATNGEVTVDLRDGVQYLLRFGGVAGIATGDEPEEEGQESEPEESGAERYLLVTARVNESMIPRPAVQPVPQSLEELAALRAPAEPSPKPGPVQPNPLAAPENTPATSGDDGQADANPPAGNSASEADGTATDESKADAAGSETPASPAGDSPPAGSDPAPAEADAPTEQAEADEDTGTPPGEDTSADTPASETSGEGTTTAAGQGGGSGAGQPPAEEPPAEQPPAGEPPAEQPPEGEAPAPRGTEDQPPAEATEDSAVVEEQATTGDDPPAEETTTPDSASETSADTPAEPGPDSSEPPQPANPWDDMTEEEQQEYLEAEQEKVKEENQRLLDEWNEQVDTARRRVRELNARFADWYYIVPESTYADLQFPLSELIQQAGEETAAPQNPGTPQFNLPGGGAGIPGLPGQP